MPFKENWEKLDRQVQIPEEILRAMAVDALGDKAFAPYEAISGGCANLNFKLILKEENNPLILRIYMRDKLAAFREQNLFRLLKSDVPLPEIYHVGECEVIRTHLQSTFQG